MLEIRDLMVNYGAITALHGISLKLAKGEIVTLIGANGAGKSTTLRAIAGVLRPRAGRVLFRGQDVTSLPSHARSALGIALVPEGRRVFPFLSVRENLELGSYLPAARNERARMLDYVCTLFPAVRDKLAAPAGALSGGQQQMVAIGRALMSNPEVLLCDELSLGLAPIVIREIYDALPAIVGEGMSVVVVEQDVSLAQRVSQRIVCLQEGRVSLEGPSQTLTREQIGEAYFGIAAAA
jgi:branched-chain amino acid transport system ATP-binding protein